MKIASFPNAYLIDAAESVEIRRAKLL